MSDRLVRTRPGSPSTLGLLELCPLAYLMVTEGAPRKTLGRHPAAMLGTAVHDATSSMITAGIPTQHAAIDLVKEAFVKQAGGLGHSSNLGRWLLGRYGIEGFVSRRQLLERSSYAISLASRLPRCPPSGRVIQSMKGSVPVGSERWLESGKLGVAGRVDFILREAEGIFRIVDFKTGKIHDDDGRVKRGYLLQMAAYARIVEHIDPAANIQLELVGRTETWSSLFDPALRSMIDAVLAILQAKLPLGKEVMREEVAVIGEHCLRCASRPSCRTYNTALSSRVAPIPRSWARDSFDVHGRVLEIRDEAGLFTLRFEDAAGGRARIVGIPATVVEEAALAVGCTFNAYALGTLELVREECFPSNFFVVDPISPRRTAFQAVITTIESELA